MTIDVNASLGHFAFRRLRHNTAAGLLALMDRAGIDRAVVASASAITYRNAQAGNEEVAAEVKAHRDRLVPVAVLNPAYAGWRDDLKACREEFGMRAVRLFPNWHNYRPTDPRCLDLVRAATEYGMWVAVSVRVEDPRQRSWLADVPDVRLDDLAALAKACPEARFVFLNGLGFAASSLGRKGGGLPANYSIEISRLTALLANELGQLLAALGADRLIFGTGMPFQYPDPTLLKLRVLEASDADKQKIRSGNAARLLEAGGR